MRKLLAIALLFMLIATTFAFAAGEAEEAAEGEIAGDITLYTSVPQGIVDRIQADFMDRYPEINLEVFRGPTGDIMTRIATEQEAGEIQGDVVWVAEPSTYEIWKDDGVLQQFEPAESDELADDMKDPDRYYYAGRQINMVIGYNPNEVDNPPTNWSDLVDEDYGTMGFPTPLNSGAAVAAVAALADRYGWDYLESFAENGGVQVSNNGTVRDRIVTGEYGAGVFLDYMARQAEADGSPMSHVWPEDGAVFIPSPLAIFEDSENAEAAELFVDYILSMEGQETVVREGNFYPVRPDVDPPEGAPGLDELSSLPIDWADVAENAEEIEDRWTEIFE